MRLGKFGRFKKGLVAGRPDAACADPNAIFQVRSFSTAQASKLKATAPAASANFDLGMDLSMNRPRSNIAAAAQPVAALRNIDASVDLSFSPAGDSGAQELASLAASVLSRAGGNWELEFTTLACQMKAAQQEASRAAELVRDEEEHAFALMLARGASFSH